MKMANYLKSYHGLQIEAKYTRIALAILALALLVSVGALTSRDPVVVLVPPGLSEKGKVMVDSADDAVLETWGMYFADQLGNVTPRTADFLDRKLAPFLSPSISADVRGLIAAQAKTIKDEQISVQFSATDPFALPEDHLVVVTGEYTIRGVRQEEKRTTRTFEFGIRIINYKPVMTSVEVYEGPWRPLAERVKKEAAARKGTEANQ